MRTKIKAPRYKEDKINAIVDYALIDLENLLRTYNKLNKKAEVDTTKTYNYEWYKENYYIGCYGMRYPDDVNDANKEMLFMLRRGGICGDALLTFILYEKITNINGKKCLTYEVGSVNVTNDCKIYEARAAHSIIYRLRDNTISHQYINELLEILSEEDNELFIKTAPKYVIHDFN